MRIILLALLMFSVLPAAAALALPGDPGFAPETPADGASVPVDANGIPASFSCPVYRTSDAGDGFAVFGGPRDYSVVMSRGTATGPDGRLTAPVALVDGNPVPGQDGECSVLLSAGGSERPQETPGVYYWQVARICAGCDTGYEVGPIRTLTLVSPVKPAVSVGGRAFGGLPFLTKVAATGAPDGTPVTVERSGGGAWTTAGTGTVLGGTALVTTLVARTGATPLRARMTIGTQDVTGAARTITIRNARTARRAAVRAGRWAGGSGVAFRIAGRSLKAFTAKVPLLCPAPGMVSPFTTQIATAAIPTIRLAPDGAFVGTTTRSGASIRFYGRVSGTRLTGARVQMSLGGCQGNMAVTARPAG